MAIYDPSSREQRSDDRLNALTTRSFADLVWASREKDVILKLRERGYEFEERTTSGDPRFVGKTAGEAASVIAMMCKGRLAKLAVRLLTADQHARGAYTTMKYALTNKYGNPSEDFDGDGLSRRRGALKANWLHPLGYSLSVSVSEDLCVDVVYESPLWELEHPRRIARVTRDF